MHIDDSFEGSQSRDPRQIQSSPVLHYSSYKSTSQKGELNYGFLSLYLTILAELNQDFTLVDNRTSFDLASEDVMPQKKVVFVGNLPINRTEEFIRHELEILFGKHGPCSMNFHLGGPKPYAFIEFVVSTLQC